MIVAIGEIPSSILTVILKINSHLYYLLTNSLLYCEIFKARRFELQTELARSSVKNENLAFHSMARAIHLM